MKKWDWRFSSQSHFLLDHLQSRATSPTYFLLVVQLLTTFNAPGRISNVSLRRLLPKLV
jgi:hypothetical protein